MFVYKLIFMSLRARLQTFVDYNCSAQTHLELNWRTSHCKNAVFMQQIYVDVFAFETALVNAAMHVGMQLSLRGAGPVQDPSTPTGWK